MVPGTKAVSSAKSEILHENLLQHDPVILKTGYIPSNAYRNIGVGHLGRIASVG